MNLAFGARVIVMGFSAVLSIACAGNARADADHDWKLCNGTVAQGISDDLQIVGCTARIQSGRESPGNLAIAFYNRGLAYDDLGQYARGIQDYGQAIALKPDYAGAINNRGSDYNDLGQYARAIQDFDRAIALKPDNANAFINRAIAYDRLGQHARAIQDFDRAIALKPDNANAFNGRCWARAIQGRELGAALADCNQAIRLSPGVAGIIDSRAFVLFRLGNYVGAIADGSAALAINPKLGSSHYVRGLAKLRRGDATGGNADIIAAKAIEAKIAVRYAGYGVTP